MKFSSCEWTHSTRVTSPTHLLHLTIDTSSSAVYKPLYNLMPETSRRKIHNIILLFKTLDSSIRERIQNEIEQKICNYISAWKPNTFINMCWYFKKSNSCLIYSQTNLCTYMKRKIFLRTSRVPSMSINSRSGVMYSLQDGINVKKLPSNEISLYKGGIVESIPGKGWSGPHWFGSVDKLHAIIVFAKK